MIVLPKKAWRATHNRDARPFTRTYLLLLMLFVVNYAMSESQLNNIPEVHDALFAMRYVILLAVASLVVVKNDTGPLVMFLPMVSVIALSLMNVILLNGGLGPLPLVMFAWASRGIRVDSIAKACILALATVYIIVAALSSIGIVNDVVRSRTIGDYAGFFSGEYVRHNAGFLISNQIPMAFSAIYLLLIAVRREKMKWLEHFIAMIINWILFYYFGSRVWFTISIAAFIGCILLRAFSSRPLRYRKLASIRHHSFPIFYLACPLCAAFSVITVWLYGEGNEFASYLNLHFNNRLMFANDVLMKYPIGLFGVAKDIGTTSFELNSVVDNGYVIELLQHGVLVELFIWSGVTYLTFRAELAGNYHLVLALVALSIGNCIDMVLLDFAMTPYYCLLINPCDELLCGDSMTCSKNKDDCILLGRNHYYACL